VLDASGCSAARGRVFVGLATRLLGFAHHFYCCLRTFNVTPQVSGEPMKGSEERRRSGEVIPATGAYEERRRGARSDDSPTLREDAPTKVSIILKFSE
jgi:hypothetical protein